MRGKEMTVKKWKENRKHALQNIGRKRGIASCARKGKNGRDYWWISQSLREQSSREVRRDWAQRSRQSVKISRRRKLLAEVASAFEWEFTRTHACRRLCVRESGRTLWRPECSVCFRWSLCVPSAVWPSGFFFPASKYISFRLSGQWTFSSIQSENLKKTP